MHTNLSSQTASIPGRTAILTVICLCVHDHDNLCAYPLTYTQLSGGFQHPDPLYHAFSAGTIPNYLLYKTWVS